MRNRATHFQFASTVVPVTQTKNDKKLKTLLAKENLNLTPSEARKIARTLKRNPTLAELWMFNVEWSEHCSYKSSRHILKKFLPTKGRDVILGPGEDAGIVHFTTHNGERYALVVAHESHNHPSQVLPVEGAATGIGGIVRDVDCMGAHVIGVCDVLRFGDPYGKHAAKTRSIASGVVDGIWQYGNALGVPNVGGDVVFSSCYDENCLVNVVALGIVKEKEIVRSRVPEEARHVQYDVILVGKPTDASGFGGASFASDVLNEKQENRGAVQVPDPFLKNVLLLGKANRDVIQTAQRKKYAIGFKDLGAGGIACAASEIGAAGGFGIEIDLSRVHKAWDDLPPEITLCAETQERYVLAVPHEFTEEVLRIYNEKWQLPKIYEGARASHIGKATREKNFVVFTHTNGAENKKSFPLACHAPIDQVVAGISAKRGKRKPAGREDEPVFREPENYEDVFLRILSSPNIASKEFITRYYDTEVQGHSVIRPGEADASVFAPVDGCAAGIAVSCDGNPFYGEISPYWGGATTVAEAMRNVASVGATPACLTDCLNFGNPETPEHYYAFYESVRGIADAAKKLYLKGTKNPVPVVSGNVSFYNASADGSAIAPSPVVACFGTMSDFTRAVTHEVKKEGSLLVLAGERHDELGGSEFYRTILKKRGKNAPRVRFEKERAMLYAVIDSITNGLILSCHDISNGGLFASVAEMLMSTADDKENEKGAEIYADKLQNAKLPLRHDKLLFSESSGFIMEIQENYLSRVQSIFKKYKMTLYVFGRVAHKPALKTHVSGKCVELPVKTMKKLWKESLREALL